MSTVLFAQTNVPVLANELMHSRAEALAVPRGNIELVADPETGLVSNRLFDEKTQAFTANYEGSQQYSAHFSAYADEIVARIVGNQPLKGKTVLEIGSGDGSFLRALWQHSGCTAIGIDPACTPGCEGHGPGRFELRAEYLSDKHHKLQPDLVICRHTLEHIGDLEGFLARVKHVIRGRPDVPFYCDVPNADRIFSEGAFWDIYYEHCHYFTADSLRRCLEANGFAATDMQLEYDDQYLSAIAFPSHASPSGAQAPVATAGLDIAAGIAEQTGFWRQWFASNSGKTVVLWGGGSKALAFATCLGLTDEIEAVVDIHPRKQGCFVPGTGHPVVAPEQLQSLNTGAGPDAVVIMNPVYRNEIAAQLSELGLAPKLLALGGQGRPEDGSGPSS